MSTVAGEMIPGATTGSNDWAFLLEGLGGPVVGFVLSSMSRGYRERRALLQAKEKASEAIQEKRWDDLINAVNGISDKQDGLDRRLVRVEAIIGKTGGE